MPWIVVFGRLDEKCTLSTSRTRSRQVRVISEPVSEARVTFAEVELSFSASKQNTNIHRSAIAIMLSHVKDNQEKRSLARPSPLLLLLSWIRPKIVRRANAAETQARDVSVDIALVPRSSVVSPVNKSEWRAKQ